MRKYWIAQNQANEVLWAHEFSKHATCFSTFNTPCYGPQAKPHEDVLDFFEATVMYFLKYPTYDYLADAGIKPSNRTAYTLSSLQKALKKGSGGLPYIGCSGPKWNATEAGKGSDDNGATVLTEVWYYSHVYGRPQEGKAKVVDADLNGGRVSNCAKVKGGVRYLERSKGSEV